MGVRVALVALLLASAAAAQEVSIAPSAVTPAGVLASSVQYGGRNALRLIEADNKRGGGIAIVDGQTFARPKAASRSGLARAPKDSSRT